jgi:hypothetical protein
MDDIIELDKWLYGASDVPEKESFTVTDLASADWTVRKAKEAEERITRREELAYAYKKRIDEWLIEANKADKDTVAYMAALLKPFVEAELKGQKTRTLKLPSGDAQIRKMPDRIEIGDGILTGQQTVRAGNGDAFKAKILCEGTHAGAENTGKVDTAAAVSADNDWRGIDVDKRAFLNHIEEAKDVLIP